MIERWFVEPTAWVVARLRDRSIVAPESGFALRGGGMLLFDAPPRPSLFPIAAGSESWRATARLVTARGRLVARLDIEIDVTTSRTVSLQLRPLDRQPGRWSARRTRRYFELAHAAADRMERALSSFVSVGVRRDDPPARFDAVAIIGGRPQPDEERGSARAS